MTLTLSGQALKSLGQAQALDRAGNEWTIRTLKALRDFCADRKRQGRPRFIMEEFRATREHDSPASVNAWGSLPALAARAGIIRDTGGFEHAQRASARSRFVKVWVAV